MNFNPIILWTDIFIWFVFFLLTYFFYILFNSNLRLNILQIIGQPLRFSAFFILTIYMAIALLDSIHFRSNFKVYSVLDKIMMPLPVNLEKTYSKPFALNSFVPETIIIDGLKKKDYPKLKHSGIHLEYKQDYWSDIVKRVILALVCAIAITLVAFILLDFIKSKTKAIDKIPKVTVMLCFFILGFLLSAFFILKFHYHILGTDKVGQDVLYMSIKSIRTGIVIGTVTSIVAIPIAIIFGTIAGYFRGFVDDIIQFIYTTLSSIPGVLLIAASILSLQLYMDKYVTSTFSLYEQRIDARLLLLCFILGICSWTNLCRLLRGETLKIINLDYIKAAKILGNSNFFIITKHIIPNLFYIILIAVTLDFSGLVLAEAVLSYVGVGVDPNTFSWGNMINSARLELAMEPVVWWSLISSFLFMFTLVLSANIFSDALRDALDPKIYD